MHDRCFDYFLHAKNSVITVLWVEFSDRRGIITLYIHQEHHHHHHHRCQHYHRHRRLVQLQDEELSTRSNCSSWISAQPPSPRWPWVHLHRCSPAEKQWRGQFQMFSTVFFFFVKKDVQYCSSSVSDVHYFFFVNKKMFIVQYCCFRVQFVSFRCSVEVLFCQKRMFSITASEFSSSIMIWKERRVVATVSFDLMNYLLDFIRGHYQWWWHHDVVSSNSNQHAALLALRSKDRADAWKCQLVSWEPCFALEEQFVKGTYWSCDDVPLDIMEFD